LVQSFWDATNDAYIPDSFRLIDTKERFLEALETPMVTSGFITNEIILNEGEYSINGSYKNFYGEPPKFSENITFNSSDPGIVVKFFGGLKAEGASITSQTALSLKATNVFVNSNDQLTFSNGSILFYENIREGGDVLGNAIQNYWTNTNADVLSVFKLAESSNELEDMLRTISEDEYLTVFCSKRFSALDTQLECSGTAIIYGHEVTLSGNIILGNSADTGSVDFVNKINTDTDCNITVEGSTTFRFTNIEVSSGTMVVGNGTLVYERLSGVGFFAGNMSSFRQEFWLDTSLQNNAPDGKTSYIETINPHLLRDVLTNQEDSPGGTLLAASRKAFEDISVSSLRSVFTDLKPSSEIELGIYDENLNFVETTGVLSDFDSATKYVKGYLNNSVLLDGGRLYWFAVWYKNCSVYHYESFFPLNEQTSSCKLFNKFLKVSGRALPASLPKGGGTEFVVHVQAE
jgi:hypothetical protein